MSHCPTRAARSLAPGRPLLWPATRGSGLALVAIRDGPECRWPWLGGREGRLALSPLAQGRPLGFVGKRE
jgi:hypothetical protein